MSYNNSTTTLLALALLLLAQWASVSGSGRPCKEEERRALLHIKAELLQIKPSLSFPEWEGEECCGWERVACDPVTEHVTKLDLGDLFTDNIFDWERQFLLNATMFLPLRQLTSLSLSGLHISGCKAGAGFDSWPSLRMPKILDLSSNYLNKSIISSLAKVSSLRTLDLEDNINFFEENVSVKEFSALKLEVVNLRSCGFSGSLPYLGDWSSLKALSLASNSLFGNITLKGLCRLKNLEELDLSDNYFAGNLPPCMGNLSSLKLVDLSDNQFRVKFPILTFERVVSLRYLSLSNNQLEGNLSISSFSNNSYLEVLGLSTNTLNFQVQVVSLPFQLQDLELANCILNVEPIFLYSQHKLRVLDLSNTRSKGLVPALWLLENNTNLIQLDLHKNFFTGPLQLPLLTHESLSILDISDNNLSGELPVDISTELPHLHSLNISKNCFQGPVRFISMKYMIFLDLSINNLTDDIQNTFSANLTNFPDFLDLSNNNFYGSLNNPTNLLTKATTLLLNDNNLSGELPLSICNTSMYSTDILDISNNELSGILPDCIVKVDFWVLKLSGNHLEGPLPSEIGSMKTLWLLDLSNNKLSGSIPPCTNSSDSAFELVDLSRNNLSGDFPITWLNISTIQAINIGKNNLSGKLPSWIDKQSNLNVLQARENMFEGHIPEQICQFKYLRILDLSHNNLSGQIPPCIIHMGLENSIFNFAGSLAYSDTSVGELNFNDTHLPFNKSIILWANGLGIHLLEHVENFGLELTSKGKSDFYGYKLLLECLLDLSSNELVGSIPKEIGQMSWLITLNLSNNYLTGAIPNSISKLRQLLSLDLSHNSLTGQIPRELTKLTSLEAFSVAYNNLSGPTLDAKAQFATFDNRSYEGNPNLCGPPLSKSCFSYPDTKLPSPDETGYDRGDGSIDFLILFGSFALFFVVSFWGFMAVLFFKKNWRYALFNLVDEHGNLIYLWVFLFVRKIRIPRRHD
ncbi:hypothetical protein LUZ63_000696 [Rhynchospora breviuscula]|uniref:Leucine-rich repeat-containing N-terminal plant-type domain-containing protein n=1 Tax=Rhynchospora breviuscula TaxID=2022672 RepID=A0A9Q0HWC3_9POAL|nr:hypothetical protein LUZ63_000696 [Rhynchospora breviuscula]